MRFLFRDVVIDADTRELTRGGSLVRVQPKVLEFLLYLVRHRERVVPRKELLAAVWPAVAVTGASVGRALIGGAPRNRRGRGEFGVDRDAAR